MGGIFQPLYEDFGLTQTAFEIGLSAALALLLLLTIIFLASSKRRGTGIEILKSRIRELEDEIEDVKSRGEARDKEKSDLVQQHEEALSKLKEAKEIILKREGEFKEYTEGFQGDVGKLTAMEEELKTYRIKLGELNKEKEHLMATYESEKRVEEESQSKLKLRFDKELEAQKRNIASLKHDFEDEMLKKERLNEKRIDDIKSTTKESMLKLTKEKDNELNDLKIENEQLKNQIERLKEEIRVLEIEKL
jgi:chromosome segregation ATPase